MPNTTNNQTSSEDRGLVHHANPAGPTRPMLSTIAEVQKVKRSLTPETEPSPSLKTEKPKRNPNKKKP